LFSILAQRSKKPCNGFTQRRNQITVKTRFGIWQKLFLVVGAVVLLAGIYAVFIVISSSSAQGAVEKTKVELRKQGFKTDLAEFNFSVPSGERGFEMSLERLGPSGGPRARGEPFEPAQLMSRAGPNSAIVAWNQEFVDLRSDELSWEEFAASEELHDPDFIAARAAVFSEPIRFNLDASRGMSMLLPHLAAMKRILMTCSSAMVVDLHNKNQEAAWTNLLAETRLVTAWEPEPSEISHIVRFTLTVIMYEAIWEALQAGGWSDQQLATLQQEWESVDFFKHAPETFAFMRAGAVDACESARKEETPLSPGTLFKEIVRSPRETPQMVRAFWKQLRYRSEGAFDDEKALLLFYRDREVEYQQAVKAPSWQVMKSMPGVTNTAVFASKYQSSLTAMLNLRQVGAGFQREGRSFLARAAEAEARRRLILAAIGLERFRIRQGHYPASLNELTPDLPDKAAIDFMDGQPLRYQLGNDGKFVLYSTGLDCVDDGGVIPKSPREGPRQPVAMGVSSGADLVWPRAASSNDIVALHEEQLRERRQESEMAQQSESLEYWNRTARRQGNADYNMVASEREINDNSFNGRWVSDILRNENIEGTNTLFQMLTLHQVITGGEGETITFEAPIKYDALTNFASLQLFVDMAKGETEEDNEAGLAECSRATNGNCLLAWHTIFETPGKHTLQLGLMLENGNWSKIIVGPRMTVEVTNICQFSISSANFDSRTGAWLFAKLPEMKADYTVEIFSPDGKRVKTMSGNTSDGVIGVFWDLIGDDHQRLRDQAFSTIFHITLPESGRSQTLRGP
jgi:hypothetical protein